jgi:hypothetical protein
MNTESSAAASSLLLASWNLESSAIHRRAGTRWGRSAQFRSKRPANVQLGRTGSDARGAMEMSATFLLPSSCLAHI